MEHLIEAFTCVLRQENDADNIRQNINALLSGTRQTSDLSTEDRLGILDFPDLAIQESSVVTTTTMSSKADLVELAALSPSDLTVAEINLLKQRYWLEPTPTEATARSTAQSALLSVSQQHWQEVTNRLKKVRAMLYEENEEDGLWNAEMEEWQRRMNATKAQERKYVESRIATAQPWVKCLWDEDQGQRKWGYAAFCDPEAVNDEYQVRKDAVLMHAREATGCGDTIGTRWRMQYLDWPEEFEPAETVQHDQESLPEPDMRYKLEARFQVMREYFKAVRDCAAKGQKKSTNTQTPYRNLEDGLLRNVFIIIDQSCVDSLFLPTANVDDMWVWAVDPDYLESSTMAAIDSPKYRGYLRVRLQQLVNNFFNVRRFHEVEYSMETLWLAAQLSKNHAFVSVKEFEQRLWQSGRFVGSAIRPKGVARTIHHLD